MGTKGTPPRCSSALLKRQVGVHTPRGSLEAVLDHAGVRLAALIGHRMGGQTILEAYARMPERITALIFLTAPFESPLRTFYGRDIDRVYRLANYAIRAVPRPAVLFWRAIFLTNPSLFNRIAQLVHALGPDTKVEDMAPYYRHLGYLDPLIVLKMAEAMHQHSARQVLGEVRVPALVLSGTNDNFTPPSLAEAMAEAIPDAQTAIIQGATHGAVIERPEEVNAVVRSFLASHLPAESRRLRAAARTGASTDRAGDATG